MKPRLPLPVLISLIASLLIGCVGVVPVPPLSTEAVEGRKIQRRDVKFIVPGVTTRLEVERRLGTATRHSDRPPATAYFWKSRGWTMYWWIMTPYGGDVDDFSLGDRHAFFVVYDDKGIVLQTAFFTPLRRGSIDDRLEEWANSVRSR